ncbi:MAG: GMC family oxidoreductase, partial [Gemmatimonadetes bacterium]|nr:GMC family oxidoreductase [Gemmatimonadota bacterium]
LQGRGVGGSTLHNTGLVYPTPPGIVERWRREHGFPLDEAEVDRRTAEVLATLAAVPIPEDRINANNAVLRRGAEALGWRYRVPLHNRLECCGCGYCMLGCAYNRKSNAALTYIPRAVAAGARVLANARAVRIEGRAGAWRVVCERVRAAGGVVGQAVVEAAAVVVAAGALDTPALLLRSGLGIDRVGRGLRLHPAALVHAVFPEPIEAWRGLPQSVLVEEFASFMADGYGGFLLIPSAGNWPGLTAVAAAGMGEAHRRLLRRLPRIAAAAVLLHDETAGRVRAARDSRPVAEYWPERADREALRRGIEALARLYLAAGAEWVHLPFAGAAPVTSEAELHAELPRLVAAPHRLTLNSVHPQGSCPLGVDPRRSTTDPFGELRGAPGIFVADASLFPTSVGVPPQVTIMMLAGLVADRVLESGA